MFTQFHTKSWPRNREMQKTTTYTPWNTEMDVLKEKSPFPSQRPNPGKKCYQYLHPQKVATHIIMKRCLLPNGCLLNMLVLVSEIPVEPSSHLKRPLRHSWGFYPPTSVPINQPQHPTKGTSSSYASCRHLSPELLVGRTRDNHQRGSRKTGKCAVVQHE